MVALVFAGALLSWPSVWNRAPLVFFDSASYLSRADAAVKFLSGRTQSLNPRSSAKGGIKADHLSTNHEDNNGFSRAISTNPFFWRPIFYSIWLLPFATAFTFLLIPFGQGLLAAYVVRRVLTTLGVRSIAGFAITMGVLAAVSSLPWHASYVMPDVFAGLIIAQAFVMVHAWRSRSRAGRAFDVVLLAGMTASHLSHVPLLMGLVLAFAAAGLFLKRNIDEALRSSGGLAAVTIALVLAIGGLVGSNIVGGHKATLSESSPIFIMTRLASDGSLQAHLKEVCPTRHYLICDPNAGSLENAWSPDGAVKRLGSPRFLAEAAEINADVLRAHPVRELNHRLTNGLGQLGAFQTDRTLLHPPAGFVLEAVSSIDTGLARGLTRTRQARSDFPIVWLDIVQDTALIAAFAVIAGAAWVARRRVARSVWLFSLTVGIGLLGNAIVTGGLSSINDRYQNRVMWLVVLVAVSILLSAFSRPAASSVE